MPLETIQLRPGIDVEQTPTLNSSGWSQSQLIRWREGMPEKLGGWQHLNQQLLTGFGRGCHAWGDLSGNPYFAVGTDQRLELFAYGTLYDITPVRQTDNVAVAFTTTITTTTVKITDNGHGAAVDDWVLIPVPVAVGGLIIQGFYQVVTVVDGNNYTITVATPATASVTAGGAVPLFATLNTSATVTTTLAAHGLTPGMFFGVQVQTVVGGITIPVGNYIVLTTPTADTFTFAPAGVATSTTSGSENGGDVRLTYLLQNGSSSVVAVQGWGAGAYGAGTWGGSSTPAYTTIRQWFLDHWGADLIGNYTQGPMITWTPPVDQVPGVPWPTSYGSAGPEFAVPANPAVAIDNTNYPGAIDPPVTVNGSFVAMPARIAVAWGVDPAGGGNEDPNLIRWSDVDDFTDWLATATNQAGSFRLPNGSRIVGALQAPNFGYFWTDVDFWLQQYIGFPLVFGFTKVASGCELLAGRAAGLYMNAVYWPSTENFFVFDGGSVQVLECTVWNQFFKNLNVTQKDKVFCWVNSTFNEVWWFFPSLNSDEVDSYVKFQTIYKVWDYGLMPRTCGIDTNVYGPPIAVDTSEYIQQHEIGYDADGQAMMPYIQSGFFMISNGDFFTVVERLVADFVLTGGNPPLNRVFITFYVQNYPTDPIYTYGPYPWTPEGPPYSKIRGRGRQAAIRISSQDVGVFWRYGRLRLLGTPGGRR